MKHYYYPLVIAFAIVFAGCNGDRQVGPVAEAAPRPSGTSDADSSGAATSAQRSSIAASTSSAAAESGEGTTGTGGPNLWSACAVDTDCTAIPGLCRAWTPINRTQEEAAAHHFARLNKLARCKRSDHGEQPETRCVRRNCTIVAGSEG